MLSVSGEDLMDLLKQFTQETEDECACCSNECTVRNESQAEPCYVPHDYLSPGDADYRKAEHIISLIEDITINTLSADGTISPESAHTLLTLANLRTGYIPDAK